MSDPVEISVLSGMTAQFVDALRGLGFYTTADILRANRRPVADAVSGLTVELLREWQTFAQILEIDGMTPAICSAASAAGIGSLDEFASRSLTQLRAIVAAAPPSAGATLTDDDLVEWLTDAVRIKCGGVLNGTVVNADGEPVEGVLARCDGMETITDGRGRFRLVRLRLGVPLTVTINDPRFGAKTIRGVRASPLLALQGTRFAFGRRRSTSKALSALTGDRLPPLGTAPIRMDAQQGPPAPNDVLRIVDRYANNDVRAVSRFFDFVEGVFVARTYRIPLAEVPAGAQTGDDLRKQGALWVRTKVSAREITREQRLIAAKRNLGARSVSDAELTRVARAVLGALSDKR